MTLMDLSVVSYQFSVVGYKFRFSVHNIIFDLLKSYALITFKTKIT